MAMGLPSSAPGGAGRERLPAARGQEAIERRPRKPGLFLPARAIQRDDFFGACGGPLTTRGIAFSPGGRAQPAAGFARRRCPPGAGGCPGGLCLGRF